MRIKISDMTGHSLKSTCDIRCSLMQQGNAELSDKGHCISFKLTCGIGPPSRAPVISDRGLCLMGNKPSRTKVEP